MLYYFTNRVVPNYFVQIPHTAHNEYLQKRFIDDLKNYNIPVTVFSNAPLTFWDYLDGIPNTLRHYRISEYIYRNYKPAYLINNHSIWLKKNLKIDDHEKELFSIPVNEMSRSGFIEMKENKFIMGDGYGYLSHQFNESILYDGNKIYMTMDVTSDKDGEIVIDYKSTFGSFDDKHTIRAKIYSGLNNLMLKTERVDSEKDISMIRIRLPSKTNLSFSSLKIFSSNFYKDDLSTSPAEYSLKWIPYIWGQYDENFKSGGKSVQDVFTGIRNINANSLSKFNFKPVAEKDSGNYLRLNARVVSKEPVNVIVSYGDANNKSGSFSFLLKQDTLFHDYLIRISSQYNWYNKNNSWIGFFPVDKDIEISQAEFLKGD